MDEKAPPFIVRSEFLSTPSDTSRRGTLISALSDADLERVAGGATGVPDVIPDWDPDGGPDAYTVLDPS